MGEKNKDTAAGGGMRTLLLMLMFSIALAACSVSGYLYWTIKSANPEVKAAGEQEAVIQHVEPLYVSMNTFTISLTPTQNESERVLYIGLSLRLADEQSVKTLETFLPEYRSRLFMLLSQKTFETLSTHEGKHLLISQIIDELKKPLAVKQKIDVTDVLFNEFILR